MFARTDLAMERVTENKNVSGVTMQHSQGEGYTRCDVTIQTQEAALALHKPCGRYITFETDGIHTLSHDERLHLAQQLSSALSPLFPADGEILICGLGNRSITSDALGTRVAEQTLVTRHLKDALPPSLHNRLRGVCTLLPGVMGVTGIESYELVRACVERIHPCAVIAVDALSARATSRIGKVIQITDTGILPGSGVGNHRTGLTQETLGVPVIALGVPTVVYSTVIVRDALEELLRAEDGQDHAQAAEALSQRITDGALSDMVVTPREIDLMISELSMLLSSALNMALQPRLTQEEILLLTNESN